MRKHEYLIISCGGDPYEMAAWRRMNITARAARRYHRMGFFAICVN